MISWIYWDPNPTPFMIPVLDRPIAWYGILFALGFFVGFYLLRRLFTQYCRTCTDWSEEVVKKKSLLFSERLTVYVIIGTVIGARLGHILFYEKWSDFFLHPMEIIKTWEGGLASHGGVVGIIVAVALFLFRSRKDFPFLSIIRIIDLLVVPSLLVATFIRLGNFVNQEVLGTVTGMPWGVVFGHPIDGSPPEPRHPAQLYEAGFYFLSFLAFWRFFPRLLYPVGRMTGIFFVVTFGFRFVVEFVKEEQSHFLGGGLFTMGQLLSVPLILFGIYLIFKRHFLKEQKGSTDPKAC